MGSAADQPYDGDALARRLDDLLERINADELVLDEAEDEARAIGDESSVATEVAPEPEAPIPDDESTEAIAPEAGDVADADAIASEDEAPSDELAPDAPPTATEVGDAAIQAAESLTADIESLTADIDALINAGSPPASGGARPNGAAPTTPAQEAPAPTLDDADDAIADDLESVLADVADTALGEDDSVDEVEAFSAPEAVTASDDDRPRDVDEVSAELTALLDGSMGMEASGLDGEAPIEPETPEAPDVASESAPVAQLEPEDGAPIEEAEAAAAGEEIDDELAALSEALLSQEEDVAPEEAELVAPADEGLEEPEMAGEGAEEPIEDEAPEESPEAEVAPADEPKKAPEKAPKKTPKPKAAPIAEPKPERAPGRVRAIVEPIIAKAAPAAATAILAASKPLEDKPARIRHTVGWMAVYTAFMAACVWVFIVVRSPVPPENASGTSVEIAKPEASGAVGLDVLP